MAEHMEGTGPRVTQLRLLPWPTPEGNPCYLSTEDPHGFLSRLADDMETAQLSVGAEMLGHARDVISNPKVSARELRFTVARLSECLYDALRVADSRGARLNWLLPDPEDSDVLEEDNEPEESREPAAQGQGAA
ncbi:hypothetical protein ABZ763_27495 [Streptomyces bacillaris]|uniref:hypothetical protein n=1 Tax=Streptomyces bacillaris TaxID=68179 RepID=UPI0034610FF4